MSNRKTTDTYPANLKSTPYTLSNLKETPMSERQVRSKLRISLLVDAIVATLNQYPQLSINAVATAAGWTQSSFQRALESRPESAEIELRTDRLSVRDMVADLAMARDFDAVVVLLDAIEAITLLQTTEETELPGYVAPQPKPVKEPKAKKAKATAEVAEGDDLEALEDEDELDANEDGVDPNEVFM